MASEVVVVWEVVFCGLIGRFLRLTNIVVSSGLFLSWMGGYWVLSADFCYWLLYLDSVADFCSPALVTIDLEAIR